MADDGILSVVLAGTATHFCVGADLVDVAKLSAVEAVLSGWLEDLDTIRRMTKPVIAAVRGYAVGGGFELALYCDLIVAAFDARFALRSEERRVGKECVRPGRSRWSLYH